MNEETLTFYYYGDGLTDGERREVEAALASDSAVAAQYRRLCQELDGFGSVETEPAPRHLVERWHDSITRAAAKDEVATQPSRSFHLGSFFWGSAVAASLALVVAIGFYMSGDEIGDIDPGNTVVDVPETTRADPSAALSRGLLVHFQESREQLVGLSPDANGERSELIQKIVQQNRLFQRAAASGDSQDLARVLRAFEPVLLRLADENVTPEDAAALQAQLAFELNIVLTKLSRNLSNKSDSIDI